MSHIQSAGMAFLRLVQGRAVNPARLGLNVPKARDAIDAYFAQDPDGLLTIVNDNGRYRITVGKETFALPPLRGNVPVTIKRESIHDSSGQFWQMPAA